MSLCCGRCGKASPVPDVELVEGEHADICIVPLAPGFFPAYGCVDDSPITCASCADDDEINDWLASRAYLEDWGLTEAVTAADRDDG